MKKCLFAAVLLTLCLPVAAQTHSSSTPSKKVVTLSGKVSADAKFLLVYRQANLTVENPTLLAGHEGDIVTVKCEKDPATNTIHIVAVKASQDEATAHARLDDAAFRR